MTAIPAALAELCRRSGIELGYWDVRGSFIDANPETLCAVLRARGHQVDGPDAAAAALAAHDRASWAELAPAVAIGVGDEPAGFGLRVPADTIGAVTIVVRDESGGEHVASSRIEELPVSFAAVVDGERYLERRATLPALPPGYHRARVTAAGRAADLLIVQAPARCHGAPGAMCDFGLFAPLYGLGGERGAAVGDLADLAELARATHDLGGRMIGTLPLLACFYERPFAPSPYSPVTRLFWNELYLDVASLAAELGAPPVVGAAARGGPPVVGAAARGGPPVVGAAARGGPPLAGAAARGGPPLAGAAAPPLTGGGLVDYRAAHAVQRAALERLARHAWASEPIRDQLEAELAGRPRLDDYARFRSAVEVAGVAWGAWPAAAQGGRLGADDVDEGRRRFHVFVQWALRRSLAAIKAAAERGETAGLYLDLPVGSSSDGYDLWRERATFAPRMSTGAPPDPLAWQGQNWALPPLEPDALRRQGYRYLIDSIRSHAEAASMLRIDHVMGLHRLFWIPDGMPAAHGVYVRYPADEMWAVVALESARQRCAIAGEDLGTVPEDLRPTMERRGAHRLFVAQFDWTRDGGHARPRPAAFGSVASLDTHDTRTFARFVEDEGLGPADELLTPWLEALGDSDADLVLVALEDLWLEREPQNVPGTGDAERANWRQRLGRSVAEALAAPLARAALEALRARRKTAAERSGRPSR